MGENKITVEHIVEEVSEEICEKHCKWPEAYRSENEDPDIAWNKCLTEKCDNCPLRRLC